MSTIPKFVHTAAYAIYLFLFDTESTSSPNVLRRQWEELPLSTSDTFRSVAKAIFDTGDSKNLGFRSEQMYAALCHLFNDEAEALLSKSLKREEKLAYFVELGSQLGVDLPEAMRGSSLVTVKRGPGRPRKIPLNAPGEPKTHQARKRPREESPDPHVPSDASQRNSIAADLSRVDSSRLETSHHDPDYIENAWATLIFDVTTPRRKRQRTG